MNETYIKNFIIESQYFSDSELKNVKNHMFKEDIDFLEALVDLKLLDQETLSEISTTIMGLPRVFLEDKIIPLEVLKNIPEPLSREHDMVCFAEKNNTLSIACWQLQDIEIIRRIIKNNKKVNFYIADRNEIKEKNKYYAKLIEEEYLFKSQNAARKIIRPEFFSICPKEDLPEHFKKDIVGDLYTEKFINSIFEYALSMEADFIFFNYDEEEINISFRIFNRNYNIMKIGEGVLYSILLKLKFLSDVNISEKYIIKQSSFIFKENNVFLTFTVTDFGEVLTAQIDQKKKFKSPLAYISDSQKEMFLMSQRKDSGFHILSGHKNSGKSTTLYSYLEFDVEKNKNIYSLEYSVGQHIPRTKQISLDAKTKTLPVISKIIKNHPDVLAVENISEGLMPILFNYVSTSKKVFLSLSSQEEKDLFLDLLLENDFDKGQMIKNFSLYIEHKTFSKLNKKDLKKYFLNKEEENIIKSFIDQSQISKLFFNQNLKKESKNSLSKITFYSQKKVNKKTSFFGTAIKSKVNEQEKTHFLQIHIHGIFNLGLSLENYFLKRLKKEKIKNVLKKEIKKSVLENALIASYRGDVDIKEVLKYLTS